MDIVKTIIKSFLKNSKEHKIVRRMKTFELESIRTKRRKKIREKTVLSDNQIKEIDDFYLSTLGEKIPLDWHQHYMSYTGRFDVRYFPDVLYIPEFERYMNLNNSYNEVYEDKNLIPAFARSAGINCIEVVGAKRRGLYYDKNNDVVSESDFIKGLENEKCVLFIKPSINSSSGENCGLVHFQAGLELFSGLKSSQFLSKYEDNYLIQRRLECSTSIKRIYECSVNTFRVITYRWKDDIFHCPTIMRIGRGHSVVDNAHAGGMFIGVSDEGVLEKSAFTEFREEFHEHPDSHIVFDGYTIENFSEVLKAAKKMHSSLPEIGIVSWDFTIGKDERPVLVEINIGYGSIWLTQMANGVGAFRNNTAEILKWIRMMRKVKVEDRKNYAFGKLE